MAKGKKKCLSAEEILEQALLPEAEQPHEVPENWVWTKLGNTIELISGRDVPTALCNDEELGIPYILGASNLEEDNFSVERWIEKPVVVSQQGDILLSVKGTIGKIYLQKEPLINISRQIMALRPVAAVVNVLYLKYYLIHISEILKEAGNGLIPGISRETILLKEVPLSPLVEQQRIVERIESLFAKLDQAKELAQNALDSFETRKAAILHKAFTGELTAKWREEHGVGMDSWKEYKLNTVCNKITDGTHNSPKNFPTGDFMYITAKNIKEHGLDLSSLTYVSKEDHDKIYPRCNVEYGDVLYIKDGATTGIATINTLNEPFSLLSSVALFKPNEKMLNSKYLVWNLNSPGTKAMMLNNMSGNAITRLTITKIKDATIKVPLVTEQQEIVRILDSLSEGEQRAKEICNVIDKIDLMKKAILARAFRGELGTNDSSEENAFELLKEVVLTQ